MNIVRCAFLLLLFQGGSGCSSSASNDDSGLSDASPLDRAIDSPRETDLRRLPDSEKSDVIPIDLSGLDIDGMGDDIRDLGNGDILPVPCTPYGPTLVTSTSLKGYGGSGNSIAVDAGGNTHISYIDSLYHLHYAVRSNGKWSIATIDKQSEYSSSSLGVSNAGYVHIAYKDMAFENLNYATNESGAWVVGAIDEPGNVGDFLSLALDGSGGVHIAYYDSTNWALKYATNKSGAWVIDTLAPEWVWGGIAIAVDKADKIHIAYSSYDETLKDNINRYMTNASGAWHSIDVDDQQATGSASIAVSASNEVHLVYQVRVHLSGANITRLMYATNSAGSWNNTAVDDGVEIDGDRFVALDAAGAAHVAYGRVSGGVLNHGTNASGTWVMTAIDNPWSGSASIAIDGGKVHFAYFDYQLKRLKYATKCP